MQYVDAQGYVRVADPNAPAPLNSMEQMQGALSDALSARGPGGPVPGQSKYKDFAIMHRRSGDPEKVLYRCYALTGSHEYRWTRKELFKKAEAENYWPFVIVDDH